jgi:hypothetical protein
MLQVPVAAPVTVLPLTVQTVGELLAKATARPELAVARAVVVEPTVSVGGEKLIAPTV